MLYLFNRELQRIYLGEGNNFERNENSNDSIQTRLEEKRCVISGEQLKDQTKVSNYDDEVYIFFRIINNSNYHKNNNRIIIYTYFLF